MYVWHNCGTGVQTKDLIISQPPNGEEALNITEILVRALLLLGRRYPVLLPLFLTWYILRVSPPGCDDSVGPIWRRGCGRCGLCRCFGTKGGAGGRNGRPSHRSPSATDEQGVAVRAFCPFRALRVRVSVSHLALHARLVVVRVGSETPDAILYSCWGPDVVVVSFQGLRKLTSLLSKSNTMIIFINQV